jgi:hypothetical protein
MKAPMVVIAVVANADGVMEREKTIIMAEADVMHAEEMADILHIENTMMKDDEII